MPGVYNAIRGNHAPPSAGAGRRDERPVDPPRDVDGPQKAHVVGHDVFPAMGRQRPVLSLETDRPRCRWTTPSRPTKNQKPYQPAASAAMLLA